MRFVRTHQNRLSFPRLPITAFLDVVLFLLLYFLLAGNLAELEAELPSGLQTERHAGKSDMAPQVVHVRSENGRTSFQIGDRVLADRASLAGVLSLLPKDQGIFVKVSGRATVEAAAAALQACRDAGFSKVNYVPES